MASTFPSVALDCGENMNMRRVSGSFLIILTMTVGIGLTTAVAEQHRVDQAERGGRRR
jgi:hypothetical protein